MGKKGKRAADHESKRNGNKDAPGRGERIPEKFWTEPELDQSAEDGEGTRQNEFRQAPRKRPPGDERDDDHALANHTLQAIGRKAYAFSSHSDGTLLPAAGQARNGPCHGRRR